MACDISSGFQLGCRDNSGGIKNVYILSGSVTTVTAASGAISDISGDGVFYQFELTKNTGDYTETPNPSLENGTVFYSQTVNISLHKLQASIRNQVKVLAQNPDLKIVVETNNGSDDNVGKFFYIGRFRGATLTGGAGTTGTAFGDANQYSLTFEGMEPQPADEITTTGVLTDALTGITVSF
tara:strand:- start:1144 stop:1689 length:546 start_codon:yes stop_codon:yes gene_type:complete